MPIETKDAWERPGKKILRKEVKVNKVERIIVLMRLFYP